MGGNYMALTGDFRIATVKFISGYNKNKEYYIRTQRALAVGVSEGYCKG